MICPSCKAAGKAIQNGLPEAARALHSDCPGGTWCDCQHHTTSSLARQP